MAQVQFILRCVNWFCLVHNTIFLALEPNKMLFSISNNLFLECCTIIYFIVFTLVERQLTGRTDLLLWYSPNSQHQAFCCALSVHRVCWYRVQCWIFPIVREGVYLTNDTLQCWKCQYWILQTSHVNDSISRANNTTMNNILFIVSIVSTDNARTLTLFKGYCRDPVQCARERLCHYLLFDEKLIHWPDSSIVVSTSELNPSE